MMLGLSLVSAVHKKKVRLLSLTIMVASWCPILTSCGDSRVVGQVDWQSNEIDVGNVYRRTAWTGELSWYVTGEGSVEIKGTKVACGCVETEVWVGDERLIPGVYPAGTRGVVKLTVRADPGKAAFNESVPLVWSPVGESVLSYATLTIRGKIVDALSVAPSALAYADVDRSAPPSFALRWTAQIPVAGTPRVEIDGDGARIDSFETRKDQQGRVEYTAKGTVTRSAPVSESHCVIRLLGLDLPAPDVPLRVGYASSIRSIPERVIELQPDGQGVARGVVTLVLTSTSKKPNSLLPVKLEIGPDRPKSSFNYTIGTPIGKELSITLTCTTSEGESRAGTLILHHGIADEPPVQLVWYVSAAVVSASFPKTEGRKE